MKKKGIQAKKNVPDRLTDEKKRRGRKFFGRLVVAFPNQNPQSAFALAAVALLHRFFSSFCASSFFFLQKEYSFVALLVGRARACIYLETRDLDASFSRDETRKRERRKENVNERKRERKRDFPLLFKRFIKGALRAEFSLTLSLSLSLLFLFVTLQASIHFCATHKHAPKRKQNAFFCFFREGGEVIEKKKSKKKNKNKNNKR